MKPFHIRPSDVVKGGKGQIAADDTVVWGRQPRTAVNSFYLLL